MVPGFIRDAAKANPVVLEAIKLVRASSSKISTENEEVL